MPAPPVAELESLATELLDRGWATRAALVREGEVIAICRANAPGATRAVGTRAPGSEPHRAEHIAQLTLETLEDGRWICVDLDALRLLARLHDKADGSMVRRWMTGALRQLGVLVDAEQSAQD
jgi:hypothetical protein